MEDSPHSLHLMSPSLPREIPPSFLCPSLLCQAPQGKLYVPKLLQVCLLVTRAAKSYFIAHKYGTPSFLFSQGIIIGKVDVGKRLVQSVCAYFGEDAGYL